MEPVSEKPIEKPKVKKPRKKKSAKAPGSTVMTIETGVFVLSFD
jgi:hypothetical protein